MKHWQNFLKTSVADKNQIEQLRWWMGTLLTEHTLLPRKMLFLVGPGPSGKGVLLKLLVSLVGEDKALEQLPGRNACFNEIINKRLIILSPGQVDRFSAVAGLVKQLLAGEAFLGRRKYASTISSYFPDCALACACNTDRFGSLPDMWHRILKINMVTPSVRVPNLLDDLLKESDEIRAWAVSYTNAE